MKHINLQDTELAKFRTQVCEQHRNGSCLSADRCADSHCQTWQRRNPNEYIYSSKLCPEIEFVKKGNKMTLVRRCSRGRGCTFAHSKEEELYHPNMYKTKMCNSYPHCTRYYCPFAHYEEELRRPLTSSKISTISPSSSPMKTHSWGSFSIPNMQCPVSPMSASTTASSTATSPILSSLSPASNTIKTAFDGNLLRFDATTPASSFSLDRNVSGDSSEFLGLEPLALSHGSVLSSAGNNTSSLWSDQTTMREEKAIAKPLLTQEEAKVYGEILANILQKEGLTTTEKLMLDRFKLESDSFTSMPTISSIMSCGAIESSKSSEENCYDSSGPPGLSCTNSSNVENEADGRACNGGHHPCTCYRHAANLDRNSSCFDHNGRWERSGTPPFPCYGIQSSKRCCSCGSNRNDPLSWVNGSCPIEYAGICHPRSKHSAGHPQQHLCQEANQRIGGHWETEVESHNGSCKNKSDYYTTQQGTLTMAPPHVGTDPLLLLTALTLLNATSTTAVPKTEIVNPTADPTLDEDTATLLIAEVLKQISESTGGVGNAASSHGTSAGVKESSGETCTGASIATASND